MEEAEEIGEAEPLLNMSTEIIVTEAPATATPVPTPAAREGIAGFFADMGDFLLAVWPYLLVVLVLLAIAAVVNKTRKK